MFDDRPLTIVQSEREINRKSTHDMSYLFHSNISYLPIGSAFASLKRLLSSSSTSNAIGPSFAFGETPSHSTMPTRFRIPIAY